MKKIKLLVISGVLLAFGAKEAGAQVMEKGKVSINTYYGTNLYTSLLKAAYINSGSPTEVSVKGFGAIGGNFEYMMTDKIGLGIDGYYATSSVSYTDIVTKSNYDPNTGNSITTTQRYTYKISIPRIGVLARANFHFTKDDNFDSYAIVAMGYRNLALKFETNDPDFVEQKVGSLVPVGVKFGVGFRYFFTDNIGLNAELALGSPLMSGGLSVKF